MSVALISALFGDEQEGFPIDPPSGVDAFFFTNCGRNIDGWQTIHTLITRPSRLSARKIKCLPWEAIPGYDTYVWVDASVEIVKQDYPLFAVESTGDSIVAALPHPDRDCVYEEGLASENFAKYKGALALAESYRDINHPEHWGLWATTSMVWRNTPLARTIAKSLWSACNICPVDQVALPQVARIHYTRPGDIPLNLYGNPWFTWHPHDS